MINEGQKDKFARARAAMVKKQLKRRDIVDLAILEAMGQLPREKFIPTEDPDEAYRDCPVQIDCGQTISQPYIVALMTQVLEIDKNCDVLEIGTGSGYQTAVLSKVAKEVFTIERITPLSLSARKILAELGITNVNFHIGDGSAGWPFGSAQDRPEHREFDRIIMTASSAVMPEPLMQQLKVGGLAVGPVGGEHIQELVLFRKSKESGVQTQVICGCRFVRLIGKFGHSE
ncbi:MAG: protein-L-isoaspartate(D-aspartate) O-methyltransferase [Sedimentisphaerales bacterium]|nr:protein-L-isoaspartate(D-aspartate) O-methyltransferase [Sedimentisphaerales bacterium]